MTDRECVTSVGKRNSGSVTVYRGGGGNMPDTITNAEKVLLAGLAAAAEDVVTVNISACVVCALGPARLRSCYLYISSDIFIPRPCLSQAPTTCWRCRNGTLTTIFSCHGRAVQNCYSLG